VLAALINAVRPLCQGDDPDVVIDAIGGASAGSMTGLLAARCLTGGFDPVEIMIRAWVTGDPIQQLLHTSGDSPLSSSKLRKLAEQLLGAASDPVRGSQTKPVRLVMMLGCLRGLAYKAEEPGRPEVEATTYVDLATFEIDQHWTPDRFLEPALSSPVDVALASGANPIGFPPQLLDRRSAAGSYRANGLTLPPEGFLWYTDGGTLDNEPLGHTLDLTNDLDQGCPDGTARVHVLIHPDPAGGPLGGAWADRNQEPTWLETLMRADHLQRTQNLYDDLRAVVKTNTRIEWLDSVIGALNEVVAKLGPEAKQELATSLSQVLGRITDELKALPAHRDAHSFAASDEVTALVDLSVRLAAGVSDKQTVGLEVVSPTSLAEREKVPVASLLAGVALGHFGGFFDENLRQSDFDLGYQCALEWVAGGLARYGLDPVKVELAKDSAAGAYQPQELWRKWGGTSLGDIAKRHPMALAELIGQLGRVSARDMLVMHHRNNPHYRGPDRPASA